MRVARVVGHVVSTVRSSDMPADKLCLLEFVQKDNKSDDQLFVAVDQLGCGVGEWVLVVSGSSARTPYSDTETKAVDLCIVGIIDEVRHDNNVLYDKRD